jgi:HEAT repeat protein
MTDKTKQRTVHLVLAWSSGILLVGLVAVCVYIYMKTSAIEDILVRVQNKSITKKEAIRRFGGKAGAGASLRFYASQPDWLASVKLKERACYLLQACGKKGVPGLVLLADHEEDRIRGIAISCIGEMGREASGAILPLLRSCENRDKAQAFMALIPLARIGPASQEELPELLRLSQSAKPYVRLLALYEIGRIQPVTEAAVSRLRKAASDNAPLIRKRISGVLAWTDGESSETKDLITKLTGDSNADVRRAARAALKDMRKAQEEKKDGVVKSGDR